MTRYGPASPTPRDVRVVGVVRVVGLVSSPRRDALTPAARRCGEGGFLTVQYVAAVGLSLVLLTLFANLIVFQYGRGLVRAAADEGARAGSNASASVAQCEARGRSVLDPLLGGSMGAGVDIVCEDAGDRVVARVSGTFNGWMPMVPDLNVAATGVAVKERAPEGTP